MRKSYKIRIGDVTIGGGEPIAIQSMTKRDTEDIVATSEQIAELAEAGCEIVRVSLPTQKSAKALSRIKAKSRIPIVADVHFNYKIALLAIDSGADKLRLNPGNIDDPGKVAEIAKKALSAKIPIRVGANSGSLRKGETLISSCLKEIRLLEREDFYNIVVSLKGADIGETVSAYREMADLVDYPFHIGITEAGTLLPGSIKNAVGCGILLFSGLGDTIRVSLTADPVEEVRVAKKILASLNLRQFGPEIVSCPVCARCKEDLFSIAREIEERLCDRTDLIGKRIAIMGCSVNGIGEAKRSEFGIVFGKVCSIFVDGRLKKKVSVKDVLPAFLKEIQ
jgi:(E)-4-hydroxy-3-methylbut-2-enyl-diphosphate synthase